MLCGLAPLRFYRARVQRQDAEALRREDAVQEANANSFVWMRRSHYTVRMTETTEWMPQDRIEMDPRVCAGKPVIKGARIPVAVLLGLLAEGESWDSILKGYPELQAADLQAALHYAQATIQHTDIAPFAPA